MKNMIKKLRLIILLLIGFLTLGSCVETPVDNTKKLNTPYVELTKTGINWLKVENAAEYIVNINGVDIYVDNDVFSINLEHNDRVKVKAISNNNNFKNSDWSQVLTFKLQETITYIVTFDTRGGNIIENQIIEEGQTVVEPTKPIKAGYAFVCWLLNGQEYNFNTSVTKDITLIASWKEEIIVDSVKQVNFLMINDMHGSLIDGDGQSIGRVDTLCKELEKQNDEYILIQNGDAFQGTYISGETYGKAMIDAMNQMDFDCFIIGNHEFDWGLEQIARFKDGDESNGEANFPFLGANIAYKSNGQRPEWIEPYTIVDYLGLSVGIIGTIGYGQESSILGSNVEDYEFLDPVSIIKTYAKELRNNFNCDIVVVATHDYSSYLNNQIITFPEESEIDAIFCAHTHQLINEQLTRGDGEEIAVVQNYHKNITSTEVIINLDDNYNYDSFTSTIYYTSNYAISENVQEVIDSYQDLIDLSNESLGYTSSNIYKSTLGGYAVEAMLEADYVMNTFGDIDVAIMNTGGIRAIIDSGDITRAEVFEVLPFNNMIVIVNLSGKLIKSLYNNNSNYLYIDVASSIGDYNNLNDNQIYQLAVIDYVFEGVYYDEFDNLTQSDYIETGIILRDELIEYIDDLY